jgi:hypothetical protein
MPTLTIPHVGAFTTENKAAIEAAVNANFTAFAGQIDWSAFVPPSGGSANGTMISFGGKWITFSGAGVAAIKLLCAFTSATGSGASLRVRGRSDVATPTDFVTTYAGDFSASAGIADYSDLLGGSFFAQDNGFAQIRASNKTWALKATVQCSGASVGNREALVVTDGSATRASGQHYLAIFGKEAAGIGVAIDGVFSFDTCADFGYFARFGSVGGYLSDSDTGHRTAAGTLLVHTPGGDKYIALGT